MDFATTSLHSNLRLKWLEAAYAVQVQLARLVSATKANFDPGQPRDDRGRWTDTGSGLEPSDAKTRNKVMKEAALLLARATLREAAFGPIVGTVLNLLEAAQLLDEAFPYIRAYLDVPRSLQELNAAVETPEVGYDIHHVVEQTPAEADGFPRSLIDAPENLVRISTLKHWEINTWYQQKNRHYGFLSPRAYLRGKDWETRVKVGRHALIVAGVLKR